MILVDASETLSHFVGTGIGDIGWKERSVDVLARTLHLSLNLNAGGRDETVST